MKIVTYTLKTDGTIPDYIVDGGYFASPNSNDSPQDFDIVGVAYDDAPGRVFASEVELLSYVQDKNFSFIDLFTKESIPLETVVFQFWSKL
jgi:hypothetical protein